ncbi:MAG: hypothetical protein RKE49_00995 [Oceanicaulis sp.]
MSLLAKLAAAAGLAALTLTALPDTAEAQHRHGQYGGHHDWYDYGRGHGRWNGPEGYFVVRARACPDLREDRRDRRFNEGRRDLREDRRDRRVLECPPRAWDYVPSRREARAGRHGDRLRPHVAYWDHRSGRYFVETRWGPVPVHVQYGRGRHHDRYDRHRGYQRSGVHFEFRF